MLLTGLLLQRYLLATAFTFGLLAFLGWLAAKVAARRGFSPLAGPPAKPGLTHALRSFFNAPATGTTPQKITRLSTVILTAHHQVHKIQDGRRTYLLATSPTGTTVIASNLEAATPDVTRQPPNGTYADDLPLEAYLAPRRPMLVEPSSAETMSKIPARRR